MKQTIWQKIKKFWESTIFPEKIRNAKAEKELRRQMQAEARLEALKEVKPQLIEQYKQKELDKMKDGGIMGKLAKGFETSGRNAGSMLGNNTQNMRMQSANTRQNPGLSDYEDGSIANQKLMSMIGMREKQELPIRKPKTSSKWRSYDNTKVLDKKVDETGVSNQKIADMMSLKWRKQ